MKSYVWGAVVFFLASVAFCEDDAISFDQRLTADGDEDPLPGTPRLKGDVTVRAREVFPAGATYDAAPSSLQHRLYFYQKSRWAFGPVEAGWLIKRSSVGPALSWENLRRFGTLKGAVELKNRGPVRCVVAGHYRMSFGQGLLFYDGFGEFVRPVYVRDSGPRPDLSPGAHDYMRGIAGRWTAGPVGWDLFVSDQPLDLPLNDDGSVNFNVDNLHSITGDVQSTEDLRNNNSLKERLAGGRLFFSAGNLKGGVSSYGLRYSRTFAPEKNQYSNARAFRGNALAMSGTDLEWTFGAWRWFGEWARSRPSGPGSSLPRADGWTATALWKGGPSSAWGGLFSYDPDFVSVHGKGVSFGVSGEPDSLPRNQRGATMGSEWVLGPWSGRANGTWAEFPASKGSGVNEDPISPSQARFALLDQRWRVHNDVECRWMVQERVEEKWFDQGRGFDQKGIERTLKWRGSVAWEPTPSVRWTLRRDVRTESVPSTGKRAAGRMWVGDAQWEPWDGGRVKARVYVFHSPEAYLTTGPEEIWDGVVYDKLAGNAGSLRGASGTRWYAIVGQKWGALRLWAKAEITRRPVEAEDRSSSPAPPRRAWHVQAETSF